MGSSQYVFSNFADDRGTVAAADTLHDIFEVHVLWRTKQGWSGQDTETALGTDAA
ncbi:hypothetical protein [Streptomyces sp. NPDC003480]